MAGQKQTRIPLSDRLEQIKRLVIIAMFSDDELMRRFVLKGGNALDLVLRIGTRASVDIDLSMENDFPPSEREDIRRRIEIQLQETFKTEGYRIFDVTLEEKPEVLSPEVATFWGGYSITFKLIENGLFTKHSGNLENLRRNAVKIGAKGKFEIDISKFEYCRGKTAEEMEGYRIFVYTPEMIACEKLRAICQQMPEYGPVVCRKRSGTARARDFVDIEALANQFKLDLAKPENLHLLQCIFEAKKVPLALLERVGEFREFHRGDFAAVKASVKPGIVLKDFDYYFDFVKDLCARLSKALGNK